MTGRPRVAKMVRTGTSALGSRALSHTAMWPSGDADGLIITKEPAPSCVARLAASKMKIHLSKLKPDLVYYLLTVC